MAAEPQVHRSVAGVERAGHVEVEHFEVLAGQILCLLGERAVLAVTVLVLEVDESVDAGEGAEAPVVELQLAGDLGGVADEAALVVPAAVVGVEAGQAVVALAGAEGHAVREGGVEAPLELAGTELDRLRRQGVQKPSGGKGAGRQAGGLADGSARERPAGRALRPGGVRVPDRAPGCTAFTNVPHEFFPCRGIDAGDGWRWRTRLSIMDETRVARWFGFTVRHDPGFMPDAERGPLPGFLPARVSGRPSGRKPFGVAL